VTVECTDVPEPAVVQTNDECDTDIEVELDEQRIEGDCPDSFTLVRTWTAQDNCGNTATSQQTITVIDSTEPVFANVPADETVECDDIPAEPTTVTATDNCDDNVEIDFEETRANGQCEDSFTLVRTWTATDNCGNIATAQQVITINDSTEPI